MTDFFSDIPYDVSKNSDFPDAKQLRDNQVNKIKANFNNPYIVAIDAALGSVNNIGKVIIENKPLAPGAAFNKSLPAIGNMSIKGIVNISGGMDFTLLQNTRLYTVMTLADSISNGISLFSKSV